MFQVSTNKTGKAPCTLIENIKAVQTKAEAKDQFQMEIFLHKEKLSFQSLTKFKIAGKILGHKNEINIEWETKILRI